MLLHAQGRLYHTTPLHAKEYAQWGATICVECVDARAALLHKEPYDRLQTFKSSAIG